MTVKRDLPINEIKSIFYECDLTVIFDTGLNCDIRFTSSYMKQKYESIQSYILLCECNFLPKLRTFMMCKDFTNKLIYVKKPMEYHHGRLIAKTRLGCLPMSLETGIYSIRRVPKNKRAFLLCFKEGINSEVESKYHFLFLCQTYEAEIVKCCWLRMKRATRTHSVYVCLTLSVVYNISCRIYLDLKRSNVSFALILSLIVLFKPPI